MTPKTPSIIYTMYFLSAIRVERGNLSQNTRLYLKHDCKLLLRHIFVFFNILKYFRTSGGEVEKSQQGSFLCKSNFEEYMVLSHNNL